MSSKVKDEEMVLLDKIELVEAKTKKMMEILKNIIGVAERSSASRSSASRRSGASLLQSALIVLPASDAKVIRAARNIPKIKIIRADSLNVVDVLSYKHLLMTQEAIGVIEKTYLNLTQNSKVKAQNHRSKLKTF